MHKEQVCCDLVSGTQHGMPQHNGGRTSRGGGGRRAWRRACGPTPPRHAQTTSCRCRPRPSRTAAAGSPRPPPAAASAGSPPPPPSLHGPTRHRGCKEAGHQIGPGPRGHPRAGAATCAGALERKPPCAAERPVEVHPPGLMHNARDAQEAQFCFQSADALRSSVPARLLSFQEVG